MDFLKTFKTELINVGIFILLSNKTITSYIAAAIKTVKTNYDPIADTDNYMLYTKAAVLLVASLVLNRVMSS